LGLLGPEAPDFGLFEDVVAAEHFVGAFTGEHHLEVVVAHKAREQVEGNGGGAQDGLFTVVNDIGKVVPDELVCGQGLLVIAAQVGDHLALVAAFVEIAFLKPDGKCFELVVEVAGYQGGD